MTIIKIEQPILVFTVLMSFETADPSGGEPKQVHSDLAALEEKVSFLRSALLPLKGTDLIFVKETHMSWVFLSGDTVFKLKKPVRYPYLDFTTLEARERYCREEVRLNSRLAPGIYRGVIPLKRSPSGELTLTGKGDVVDWLVEMKRLPADDMLDMRLQARSVRENDVIRVAHVLARFYRNAERPTVDPEMPFRHFTDELAENRSVLLTHGLLPDSAKASILLNGIEEALQRIREPLRARALAGHIVDGHGDLRPEHVCLTEPVVIFDCLEFNRDLRLVDPFDELAFLAMECARLDAGWFGHDLIAGVADLLGESIPHRLVTVYTALHAALRARLSLAHLLDPVPREPQKWVPLAGQYLVLVEKALVSFE